MYHKINVYAFWKVKYIKLLKKSLRTRSTKSNRHLMRGRAV